MIIILLFIFYSVVCTSDIFLPVENLPIVPTLCLMNPKLLQEVLLSHVIRI